MPANPRRDVLSLGRNSEQEGLVQQQETARWPRVRRRRNQLSPYLPRKRRQARQYRGRHRGELERGRGCGRVQGRGQSAPAALDPAAIRKRRAGTLERWCLVTGHRGAGGALHGLHHRAGRSRGTPRSAARRHRGSKTQAEGGKPDDKVAQRLHEVEYTTKFATRQEAMRGGRGQRPTVQRRPAIPRTIKTMHNSRTGSRDSPKSRMPRIAVPTAPIPVHTA